MKHHECGPSSLYRRSMCWGSLNAELGLESKESEYSEEGNLLHAAVWDHEQRKSLTADQLRLLETIDYNMDKIAAENGILEWRGESSLSVLDGSDKLTFGTVDAWGVTGGHAVLIDFKFGFKEVSSPASNFQLAAYAAGLAQKAGANTVTAYIIQPRVSNVVTKFTFTKFGEIIDHIKQTIRRCQDPEAPRTAGSWCEYCKAFDKCQKVEEMKNELVKVEATAITPANADDIYEKCCLVEKKLKELKKQCKQSAIDNGGRAGRLEIREKNGARYIPDLQAAYEAVQDVMSVQEFLGHCSANIGKLEDTVSRILKDRGECPSLKAAKMRFNEITGVKNKKSTIEIRLNKS